MKNEIIKIKPQIILEQLFKNPNYTMQVIPHIQTEYFESPEHQTIFSKFKNYFLKFKSIPTIEEIGAEITDTEKLEVPVPAPIADKAIENLISIEKSNSVYHDDWLLEETESFCRHQAFFEALKSGIETVDNIKSGKKTQYSNLGKVEDDIRKALAFSFDNRVGHDYFYDYNDRWEIYSKKEKKIPFALTSLDRITGGGLPPSTLSVFLAGPNVGKSAVMCHLSASYILRGYNVLYISMEMSEDVVAKRIDANLLKIDIDTMSDISYEVYTKKFKKLSSKTNLGKLYIKKYPTSGANVNHFRALINEIKHKKGVMIDVICLDYMGICSSSRLSMSSAGGSYGYLKAISEEVRGLADEEKTRIITGAQTNRRGGTGNSLELDDVAESYAINATSDLIIGLSANDEQRQSGLWSAKLLKSRFGSRKDMPSVFQIGFNEKYMQMYDVEDYEAGE